MFFLCFPQPAWVNNKANTILQVVSPQMWPNTLQNHCLFLVYSFLASIFRCSFVSVIGSSGIVGCGPHVFACFPCVLHYCFVYVLRAATHLYILCLSVSLSLSIVRMLFSLQVVCMNSWAFFICPHFQIQWRHMIRNCVFLCESMANSMCGDSLWNSQNGSDYFLSGGCLAFLS